jgi:hypothetical protein
LQTEQGKANLWKQVKISVLFWSENWFSKGDLSDPLEHLNRKGDIMVTLYFYKGQLSMIFNEMFMFQSSFDY